ncbi:MAG TPA: HAD hydrolase family protein [Terriglobales bacterium]|nr:HAD hydrolase family protein [Terriglobales bacterium]
MSKPRAKKIKLLLFDVDGVMTDGTIWFFPAPPGVPAANREPALGEDGKPVLAAPSRAFLEAKGFHAHDGTGITLARLGGLKTGLITKRISETVALRARDLRMDYVCQGVEDKVDALEEILKKERMTAAEVAYVGDDVIDLPVMRRCGLAVAVPNAREEVKDEAHIITDHRGGEGAVRDAVEYILQAQGKWHEVVEGYVAARSGRRS